MSYKNFFAAVLNENLNKITQMLNSGFDINYQIENGNTPLILASLKGHIDIVKELLKKGADIEAKNNNGETPLILASYYGYTEIVKELLKKGANPEGKDNDNNTPLLLASFNGHTEIVKELLEKGVDTEVKTNNGVTPLIVASSKGHIEVVKELLEKGADIEAKNNNGDTPLIFTSLRGYTEIVKELLEKGANIEAKNNNNNTPLLFASFKGHTEIVKELLEKGADPKVTNNDDKNAFELAKTEEIKNLIKSYMPMPKWKGWTQSDASKFDTIFDTEPDPVTGHINANDYSCCPFCLKYVERSEACMYMKHDCSKEGGFYHEYLYNKYKNNEGKISWCTICGRPAIGHAHYERALPYEPKPSIVKDKNGVILQGDPFENDCRISNGGGGLPEKLARFRRLREYVFELQDEVGQITEEEVYTQLVEEVWKALMIRKPQLKKIKKEKKWNIPSNLFFPNVVQQEQEEIYANVPWANKNNPDLKPIKTNVGTNTLYGDENIPILQFRHRQDDGSINNHENDRIGIQNFTNWLKEMVTKKFGDESFGYCYMYPACKAKLYPDEIKDYVSPELYEEYKKKFNKRFGAKEGGKLRIRKTKKVKKQKGGNSQGLFQEAKLAVCNMPVKGGRRKSRRSKRKTHKRKH